MVALRAHPTLSAHNRSVTSSTTYCRSIPPKRPLCTDNSTTARTSAPQGPTTGSTPRESPHEAPISRLATVGAGVILVAAVLSVATASASPVEDKKAQAEKLQQEIDANGEKISMLAERYNEAKLRVDDATKNIAKIERRVSGATVSATHTGDLVKLQPVFREGYQFAV
jgi:hypothetical protein